MTRYVVSYNEELIAYEVRPARKRRAALGLYVYPDGRVHVTAPPRADLNKIHQHVQEHAEWISRQLKKFMRDAAHKISPSYKSGEVHLYLGKGYPLRFEPAADLFNSVDLGAESLLLRLSNMTVMKDPVEVRTLLDDWYLGQADEIFECRLRHFAEILPWVSQMPQWRHAPMKSQWGSCSAKGKIALNTQLIKCPIPCIDSVIVHEFCHLKHRNHGKRFYALLEKHVPDWRDLKRELNALTHQVLAV
ncbi:MAG: M48 family metallopeptidase [Pseudomonadales bacterium]|nr:M48 family metallopeptidase [Pseudomonadales bacterium]